MAEIGVYEAKTHLAKLLERVEKGERFIITRHGRPVAELRPVSYRSREDILGAIEGIKAFASTHRLRGLLLRDMIREGRKR